jgi:hypothetical protein
MNRGINFSVAPWVTCRACEQGASRRLTIRGCNEQGLLAESDLLRFGESGYTRYDAQSRLEAPRQESVGLNPNLSAKRTGATDCEPALDIALMPANLASSEAPWGELTEEHQGG